MLIFLFTQRVDYWLTNAYDLEKIKKDEKKVFLMKELEV